MPEIALVTHFCFLSLTPDEKCILYNEKVSDFSHDQTHDSHIAIEAYIKNI